MRKVVTYIAAAHANVAKITTSGWEPVFQVWSSVQFVAYTGLVMQQEDSYNLYCEILFCQMVFWCQFFFAIDNKTFDSINDTLRKICKQVELTVVEGCDYKKGNC